MKKTTTRYIFILVGFALALVATALGTFFITKASIDTPEIIVTKPEIVEPEIDKSKLQTFFNIIENVDQSNYTFESYRVFSENKNTAKEILNNDTSTQKNIDEIHVKLMESFNNLVLLPDKNKLIVLYEMVKNFDEVIYTTSSFLDYKEKLASAKLIIDQSDATQSEVDDKYNELFLTANNLVIRGNKVKLTTLVLTIEGINKELYMTNSIHFLEKEIENANLVLSDIDAIQIEVDKAYNNLMKKFDELVVKGNKDLVSDYLEELDAVYSGDYTEASFEKFLEIIQKTKMLLEAEEISETEINMFIIDLRKSFDQLDKLVREELDIISDSMKELIEIDKFPNEKAAKKMIKEENENEMASLRSLINLSEIKIYGRDVNTLNARKNAPDIFNGEYYTEVFFENERIWKSLQYKRDIINELNVWHDGSMELIPNETGLESDAIGSSLHHKLGLSIDYFKEYLRLNYENGIITLEIMYVYDNYTDKGYEYQVYTVDSRKNKKIFSFQQNINIFYSSQEINHQYRFEYDNSKKEFIAYGGSEASSSMSNFLNGATIGNIIMHGNSFSTEVNEYTTDLYNNQEMKYRLNSLEDIISIQTNVSSGMFYTSLEKKNKVLGKIDEVYSISKSFQMGEEFNAGNIPLYVFEGFTDVEIERPNSYYSVAKLYYEANGEKILFPFEAKVNTSGTGEYQIYFEAYKLYVNGSLNQFYNALSEAKVKMDDDYLENQEEITEEFVRLHLNEKVGLMLGREINFSFNKISLFKKTFRENIEIIISKFTIPQIIAENADQIYENLRQK